MSAALLAEDNTSARSNRALTRAMVLKEMRSQRADMPIIFITGYGDVPMTVRAMKAGATEFLTKPFGGEALLDAIRNALALSFWLEEFAAPYYVFGDAGIELTLASPKGRQLPIDPKSDLPDQQTPAMARFKQDKAAQNALAHTVKLADMRSEDFDAIFYSGGHGPMWDLVDNPDSIALIESFYNSDKPVAAVCHSPAVLHRVIYQGAPIVQGKRVTGFANSEEEAVQLTHAVPFLVEDELKRLGGLFEKAADWQSFANHRRAPYHRTESGILDGGRPGFAASMQTGSAASRMA
jgi:putative intracellular protease/amidase